MSRHAQVALAGAQGLSLFSYSSTDPVLTLSASVPTASSAVVFHSDGSRFLTISSDGLEVSVFTRGGLKLYDVKRVSSGTASSRTC